MNKPSSNRIFLSPPHMTGKELQLVEDAFESNYIAPLGPMVDAFECEFAEYTGVEYCVAVSSGTAALHLALQGLEIGPGDEVFASSLTFIGSVTPIVFQGATPVFIDCDRTSWNMNPDLLEEELERCDRMGRLPKAVVPTDLYGQCCDLGRIVEICDGYGVPVICDSAESLGGRYLAPQYDLPDLRGKQRRKDAKRRDHELHESYELNGEGRKTYEGMNRMDGWVDEKKQRSEVSDQMSEVGERQWVHAGKGAKAAVFSFNGNKIITTSGGGMLASDDEELIEHSRFLSQQARDPFPHYEHSEIGYNYRMSNVLAAIGRGQLRVIEERVRRKRKIFDFYEKGLEDVPGIEFMPEAPYGRSNRWLTVILITPEAFGADQETVRLALETENIEARPVWKPMHVQPVFQVEWLKAQGLRCKVRVVEGTSRGQRSEGGGQKGKQRYKVRVVGGTSRGQRSEVRGRDGKKHYSCRVVGGEVAEDLFERGLCLPSGTAMTEDDLDRVVSAIRRCYKS